MQHERLALLFRYSHVCQAALASVARFKSVASLQAPGPSSEPASPAPAIAGVVSEAAEALPGAGPAGVAYEASPPFAWQPP